MPDFVTLTCPSCGAKLEIGSDIEKFACGFCGNEHIVKRSGGIVALSPLIEGIKGVKQGVDKTASELAIKRLKDEIREIRAGMPETGEGCLAQTGMILAGLGVMMLIGGIITGDGGTIAGAVLTAAIFVGLGIWLGKIEGRKKAARLKPYYDAISKKVAEINRHEAIING
jgi:hypothetical protein